MERLTSRIGLKEAMLVTAGALYIFAMAWSASTSTKVIFLVLPLLVYGLMRFFVSYTFAGYVAIVSSTLNTLSDGISQPLLHPDKLFMILGCVSIVFLLLAQKKFYVSAEVSLFFIFISYTFLISYLKSPVFNISISGIVQLTIAFLGFVVMLQFRNYERSEILKYIKFFSVICVLQTVYGLVSFYAWTGSKLNLGGVMLNQWGDSVTIKGTIIEANLFGSLIGAFLLVSIALLFSNRIQNKKIWVFMSVLLFVGIIFSWTRSAWIGFMVGVVILIGFLGRKVIRPKTLAKIVLLLVLIIAPIFVLLQYQFDSASSDSGLFSSKLANLFNADEGTGLYRAKQYAFAYNDIGDNQLTGKGYYSIKVYGDTEWIGNTFLSIYHDTGIIGSLLFLLLLLSVAIKSIKFIADRQIDWNDRVVALGLFTGFLLLIISYNFSPGHILSLFWVYTGLMVAYVSKRDEEKVSV